jgi:hypothetical protein
MAEEYNVSKNTILNDAGLLKGRVDPPAGKDAETEV